MLMPKILDSLFFGSLNLLPKYDSFFSTLKSFPPSLCIIFPHHKHFSKLQNIFALSKFLSISEIFQPPLKVPPGAQRPHRPPCYATDKYTVACLVLENTLVDGILITSNGSQETVCHVCHCCYACLY